MDGGRAVSSGVVENTGRSSEEALAEIERRIGQEQSDKGRRAGISARRSGGKLRVRVSPSLLSGLFVLWIHAEDLPEGGCRVTIQRRLDRFSLAFWIGWGLVLSVSLILGIARPDATSTQRMWITTAILLFLPIGIRISLSKSRTDVREQTARLAEWIRGA